MSAESKMTAAERNELKALTNEHARLETKKIAVLVADRIVEADREFERIWSDEDLEITKLTAELKATVDEINTKIRLKCEELGIHESLRPEMLTGTTVEDDDSKTTQLLPTAADLIPRAIGAQGKDDGGPE